MDEMGFVPLHAIGTIASVAICCAVRLAAGTEHRADGPQLRPLLRLLAAVAALSALGGACFVMHGTIYAFDGEGVLACEMTGEIFMCMSRIALSTLHLHVASGRALPSREQSSSKAVLRAFVLGAAIVIATCELYGRLSHVYDWSMALHFYQSAPGFLVIMLDIVLFVEVARASLQHSQQPDAPHALRRFYMVTLIAAALNFLLFPGMCAVAHVVPPWQRKTLLVRTEAGCRIGATGILALVLRPAVAPFLELPDRCRHLTELSEATSWQSCRS